MKKLKENVCPQNTVCPNVKNCNVYIIEEIGYGAPFPVIEDGKCIYCEKCSAAKLKSCMYTNGE